MRVIHSIYICLTCVCIIPQFLSAQNTCTNALFEANKLYEAGKLNDCINRLNACSSSLKLDEKIESYHLLGLAYLALDNQEQAKIFVVKLLKAQPDYKKFPNIDPLPFKKLIDEVEIKPGISAGVNTGINFTNIKLLQSYSTYNTAQEYKPVLGYQYGLNATVHLKNDWGIRSILNYSGLGINHIIDSAAGWNLNYSEEQKYFQLKAMAQYSKPIYKRYGVFGGLGFGAAYMTKSNVFFESINLSSGSKQQVTQNPVHLRNRFQYSFLGNIGFSVALSKGMISIETGMESYFKTTVNKNRRMEDLKFNFTTQYVNDDISLRMAFVNFRYSLPIVWKVQSVNGKEPTK